MTTTRAEADDQTWAPPADSLPEGIEADDPLEFEEAISDVDELPDDDG